MIRAVAKHFMTAQSPKADPGFKSSFPTHCLLEERMYSLLCDAEWLMSWGCQYFSIDYEYSILLHSLDFMHVSNQNADSKLLLPRSKWHFQRHDLTYAKRTVMMIILTEEGAKWNPLLTAHKRRMLRSKSPSPATSRRKFASSSCAAELKHSLWVFLTLISNVIEVPIH